MLLGIAADDDRNETTFSRWPNDPAPLGARRNDSFVAPAPLLRLVKSSVVGQIAVVVREHLSGIAFRTQIAFRRLVDALSHSRPRDQLATAPIVPLQSRWRSLS